MPSPTDHALKPAQPVVHVKCPLCGQRVPKESYFVHATAERWVLEKIQAAHPEWVEQDGGCRPCYDYYKQL